MDVEPPSSRLPDLGDEQCVFHLLRTDICNHLENFMIERFAAHIYEEFNANLGAHTQQLIDGLADRRLEHLETAHDDLRDVILEEYGCSDAEAPDMPEELLEELEESQARFEESTHAAQWARDTALAVQAHVWLDMVKHRLSVDPGDILCHARRTIAVPR